MEIASFTSRRPAAGGLPQFHLPPPNSQVDVQVPSMIPPLPTVFDAQPIFPPPPHLITLPETNFKYRRQRYCLETTSKNG